MLELVIEQRRRDLGGFTPDKAIASSKKRIEQAKADWRAGRMKLPDLDNGEFIPLPNDPLPAAKRAG